MTKDEMRFLRREIISTYLREFMPYARTRPLYFCKLFTRRSEVENYGHELNRYA